MQPFFCINGANMQPLNAYKNAPGYQPGARKRGNVLWMVWIEILCQNNPGLVPSAAWSDGQYLPDAELVSVNWEKRLSAMPFIA